MRELQLQRIRGGFHVIDERSPLGTAGARRQRRDVEPERVQRLAQVVACSGEQLAFRPVGGFCGCAGVDRAARPVLELADQVDVFVADDERARQDVVQPVTEAEDERKHDAHHPGDEQMHGVADDRDPHDQRHERGKHETVERRLVDGGEIEAAERYAEQADDQQRLVRRRGREHRDGSHAP